MIVCPAPGCKKTALAQNLHLCKGRKFPVVPPCLPRLGAAALREANTPLPGNGGCRQRILGTLPFPRALSEPFVCSAFRPVPSIGGSLWVRLQFYFRFIGLKYL